MHIQQIHTTTYLKTMDSKHHTRDMVNLLDMKHQMFLPEHWNKFPQDCGTRLVFCTNSKNKKQAALLTDDLCDANRRLQD